MKQVFILLTVAILAIGGTVFAMDYLDSRPEKTMSTGDIAPSFSAIDTNGKTVSLDSLKGKYVILEWTNHQCPFVRKHYNSGNMQALQQEIKSDDTVWISVISSAPGRQGHVSATKANDIATAKGATPDHIIIDESGEIGQQYGAQTTPHMFILNKDGMIVYQGAIDSKRSPSPATIATSTNYIRSAFNDIRANKPVQIASTRPYGCSVKY
jgi:peroxiredoxin